MIMSDKEIRKTIITSEELEALLIKKFGTDRNAVYMLSFFNGDIILMEKVVHSVEE